MLPWTTAASVEGEGEGEREGEGGEEEEYEEKDSLHCVHACLFFTITFENLS